MIEYTQLELKKNEKTNSSNILNTIYEVLFILLKEENSSALKLALLRLIDFFQLMVFPFDSDAEFPWRATILYESLTSIVEVFQIINYLSNLLWSTYLIIFYLGIFLVILIIFDIIYVFYSISRKKFSVVWPLKVLRTFCGLFVTVLFLPLLKLFISIITCKTSENGDYVHVYYPEITCWQGFHIFHSIMASIISIIFICISLVVTLTFYEAKGFCSSASSKTSNRIEFFLLIYKISCIILFAFLSGPKYSWFLVTVLVLGSGYNYYQTKTERPNYNESLATLYNITSAAYLYIVLVLCLCMLLKDTDFAGGVQLIVLGLPLVSLIEFFSGHPKTYWLTKDFDVLTNGNECSKYLRYFTYVTNSNEQDNEIILDTHIMKHINKCTNPSCQVTVYRNNCYTNDNTNKGKKVIAGRLALASYIKKLYKGAVRQYYNFPSLRINYAFFLADTMKDLVGAQKQLRKAKCFYPKFDEEFVIFRYGRILEEKMTESKHQREIGMDRVSLIAYENYFRQCKKKMKEVARLHIEFWSGLNTQTPDLAQLTKIAIHINKVITEIEEYWDLLEDINANIPKAILSYAKFLHDVLSDEEAEKEILKNIKQDKKTGKDLNNKGNESEFGSHFAKLCSSEGTPYLVISGDVESLGIIKDVNKSGSRIFGYCNEELVGQHMEKLLPPILRVKHREVLMNAAENQDNFSFLSKERVVPCQLANGYILIMTKSIRLIPSFTNDMNYVLTFKLDRAIHTKSVCYLLLDNKGTLVSISEKAVTMLKLSNNIIKDKNINIKEILPELNINSTDLDNDESLNVSYTLPIRSNNEIIGNTEGLISKAYGDRNYMEDYNGTTQFLCKLTPIFGKQGYMIRLAKPEEITMTLSKTMDYAKNCKFEIHYDTETEQYQRKLFTGSNKSLTLYDTSKGNVNSQYKIVKEGNITDDTPRHITKNPSVFKKDHTLMEMRRALEVRMKNYSAGIHTYQLLNGEMRRVKNCMASINMEDEEINKRRESELIHERNVEKIRFLNSRKQYKQSIKNQPIPASIRNLTLVSIVLFLTFIGLTIIMYCITESSLFLLRNIISLPWKKNNIIYYAFDGLYLGNSLALLQNGIITGFEDVEDPETTLRDQIHYDANEILKLITEVTDLIYKFPKMFKIFVASNGVQLLMYKSEDDTYTVNYTCLEIAYILTSSLLDISSKPKIEINDLNLKFLRENLPNSYLNKDFELHIFFYYSLKQFIKDRINHCLIVMIIAICLYLINCILLYSFLLKAHRSHENVLCFFLRIPTDAIIQLQEKCEDYLAHKDIDTAANKESEITESNNSESTEQKHNVKRKEFLKIKSVEWSYLWNILLVMLILDSCCIIITLYISYVETVIDNYIDIICSISELDSTPLLVMISLQNYIIASQKGESSWDVNKISGAISNITEQTEKIVNVNIMSDWLYKKRHVEYFNVWMYDSVCIDWSSFNWFENEEECNEFLSRIPTQGFYSLMMEYVFIADTFMNQFLNQSINEVFDKKEWKDMWPIARYIVHTKNLRYMDYLIEMIYGISKDAQIIALIISLCYILIFLIYFLIFWIPYIFALKKEICRTNSMLLLIPIDVYLTNKYLRKIFEQKLSDLGMNK